METLMATIQLFGGAHDGLVLDKTLHGSYLRIPIVPPPSMRAVAGNEPVIIDEYEITAKLTMAGHYKAVLLEVEK